jgi:hypothetical protein
MVHGLLHLLGHDHEGAQAATLGPSMEAAERLVLGELEWGGGGLIASARLAGESGTPPPVSARSP